MQYPLGARRFDSAGGPGTDDRPNPTHAPGDPAATRGYRDRWAEGERSGAGARRGAAVGSGRGVIGFGAGARTGKRDSEPDGLAVTQGGHKWIN